MSKLLLALVTCALTFSEYCTVFGQTFTGASGSNWNTSGSWSSNSVPSGATTSVTINANPSINGSNVTIGNITTSSTAAITLSTSNGANLTVGSISNSANVTFSKGGELDVNHSAVTIYGNLVINIPTGSTFTLSVSNGGTLDIKGSITITGGGNLIINNNNTTLTVGGGITGGTGTYTISNTNGGHFSVGGAISGGTLSFTNNNSTFSATGDISSTVGNTIISNTNGAGLTFGGDISSAGTLSLTNNNASVSVAGDISTVGDTTMSITNGGAGLTTGGAISSGGALSMTINNATVSASGGISGSANSSISDTNGGHLTSGGAVSLGNNSTITDNNATISASGFTIGTGSCVNDSNGGQIINTTTGQTCTSSSCTSPCSTNVVVLPVTLTDFYLSLGATSIDLKWSTATELNFDYFSLQKSADGKSFYEIAQVQGHGTTNVAHNYSYQDQSPLIGKNYYRLTSVDFDNYQETFRVIEQDYTGAKDFTVSPNPTDGTSITFNLNFGEANGNVTIYDQLGLPVASYQVNETSTILFTNPMKSGFYVARYSSPLFSKAVRFVVK